MKKKYKILITIGIVLSVFSPLIVNAVENEKEEVCFYKKNCHGDLEYVCVDPDEVDPQQLICPPGCHQPEE